MVPRGFQKIARSQPPPFPVPTGGASKETARRARATVRHPSGAIRPRALLPSAAAIWVIGTPWGLVPHPGWRASREAP